MKAKTGNCLSRKTTQTETQLTQLRLLFLFGNLNIAVEWAKIAIKQWKFSTDVGFFTLPYFLSNGVSKIHYDHGLFNENASGHERC